MKLQRAVIDEFNSCHLASKTRYKALSKVVRYINAKYKGDTSCLNKDKADFKKEYREYNNGTLSGAANGAINELYNQYEKLSTGCITSSTNLKAKTPIVQSSKGEKVPASATNKIIKGLAPWSDDESEVLILGTLPSQVSIDSNFYYNDKSRNSFWKIIHAIFGKGEDSKDFLLKNRIALWDVFESAPGTGNKDSSRDYVNGVPNKIEEFIDSHKNIKGIILNGVGKTTYWFKDKFPSLLSRKKLKIISVNNSSNLNSRDGKAEEWKQAIDEIMK